MPSAGDAEGPYLGAVRKEEPKRRLLHAIGFRTGTNISHLQCTSHDTTIKGLNKCLIRAKEGSCMIRSVPHWSIEGRHNCAVR
ncbi:hypothetical protein GCM10007868_17080 [Gluconobacter frateurii]|uniref:Uncharacterized protein n=1 Tax=Gluconobacter frateurii NRIC 0228 TaxID=1307946 RepID=A0ABQ0QF63_9PROT|nr:hypothetical protein AA0228_2835 [Gluconobacter frateurii NRIC 0228]GLP90633.1 hypothetical protein GCM10007868_17080 [Gluconobacter frateurii]